MAILYNFEITVCTLSILAIVFFAIKRSSTNLSTDKLLFSGMLKLNAFLVVSDFIIQLIKGRVFPGSHVLLYILDMIDIEGITVLSYMWVHYTYTRLNRKPSVKAKLLWDIPLLIATLGLLSNPFTNLMFKIDEYNIYSRCPGIYIQWIASWIFTYGGAVIAIRAYLKARNKVEKKNALPLICFVIFPAIGSLMQTFVYGISATKLFISLGMIMVYTITTGNEVSVDALTGLNNRGEMEKYVMNCTDMTKGKNLTVVMIDMNDFKKINDTLGHNVGDEALKKASDILRKSCRCITQRLFLCRFGGDEFVIIGADLTDEEISRLEAEIQSNTKYTNDNEGLPYFLSVSVGSDTMFCNTYKDFETLMHNSDEKMYENKKKYKASKAG